MSDDRFRGLIIDIEIYILATHAANRQPDYKKNNLYYGEIKLSA